MSASRDTRGGKRPRALLVGLLLALAAGNLGNSCTGVGANASLGLQEATTVSIPGQGFIARVQLSANASHSYRAYDVDVQWTPTAPTVLTVVEVAGEFSDDGPTTFVRMPDVDWVAGTMTGIVDARHGQGGAVFGESVLVELLFWSISGDEITVSATGVLARSDGAQWGAATAAPLVLSSP